MSFIKKHIEKATIKRRDLLLASAYGIGAGALGTLPKMARAKTYKDPTIAWSYRNRTNPYWNEIVSGGEAFVKSLGKPVDSLVHLINEGSSEKSLADVRALVRKTGGDLALAIDTNDSPNARPVVESCVAGEAYVSTLWNKTDDLHPWDFGDYYVSHMARAPSSASAASPRTTRRSSASRG